MRSRPASGLRFAVAQEMAQLQALPDLVKTGPRTKRRVFRCLLSAIIFLSSCFVFCLIGSFLI